MKMLLLLAQAAGSNADNFAGKMGAITFYALVLAVVFWVIGKLFKKKG